MKEFFIKSNEKRINIITNNDEINNPSNVIIHIHGAGSHFQHIMDTPNSINYRMNIFREKLNSVSYGLEFSNHGKSNDFTTNNLGLVNDINDLINDLNMLLIHIKYNLPIFIIAESMGAGVCIKNAIINNPKINGYIFLAPLCGIADEIKPNIIMKNILIYGSYLYPSFILSNNSAEKVCMYDKYNQNKINCVYNNKDFKIATGRECYNLSIWIESNCDKFNDNILIIQSTNDKITCVNKTKEFFYNCSSINKELFLLDEGNHTVLVPRYKDDYYPQIVYYKIINYINSLL
jgi:caffeoylshikimate esterase